MPVLARRRHEIGEPVEELKRRELDDAIGSRPRGLPPTTPPDTVGRPNGDPAPREHVADLGDAAGWAADQEPRGLACGSLWRECHGKIGTKRFELSTSWSQTEICRPSQPFGF
jgi:hypothetical protein